MEDSLSIVDSDLLPIEDPDPLEKVIKLMELIIATSSLSQLRIFFGIGIFLLYLLILIFDIALVVMGRTLRRQSCTHCRDRERHEKLSLHQEKLE